MTGGYSTITMSANILAITMAPITNFAGGRANLNKLIKTIDEGSFQDALHAIHLDSKDVIIKELKDSADDIKDLSDNRSGYGQKLADFPGKFERLKAAVSKFQDVLNAIKKQPSFIGVTQPDRVLEPARIERIPKKGLPIVAPAPAARDQPLPLSPPPSPPERRLPEPAELPPPIELLEARPLRAAPLQEVSAPPARGIRARPSNALGAVPAAAEGMNLAGPTADSLALPAVEGPRDMTPRPKVNPVYVAPPGAERSPAPVIPDVSSTTRSGLPPRVPGAVSAQQVPQSLVPLTSAPGRSALAATASPGVLQQQLTPDVPGLQSEEQKAFLKGEYQSVDTTKSVCERRYPTIYSLLESGKFNGSDIISLLNSNDPKVLDLFTAIGYDREAKTIMGHPLVEVYRACHPDRTVSYQEQLTKIFQVLKALETFTGTIAPTLSLPEIVKAAIVKPLVIDSKEASQPGGPGAKSDKPERFVRSKQDNVPSISRDPYTPGDHWKGLPDSEVADVDETTIIKIVGLYDPKTGLVPVSRDGYVSFVRIGYFANFKKVPEFKRGDRWRSNEIAPDPKTGERVMPIITVVGDYDPGTDSVPMAYQGETRNIPTGVLQEHFTKFPEFVQKRLFRKGDRIIVSEVGRMNVLKKKLEAEGCEPPYTGFIRQDQKRTELYVYVQCDSGDKFAVPEEEVTLFDNRRKLVERTAVPAPTPQNVLGPQDFGTPGVRRGVTAAKSTDLVERAPANITECDQKLAGMTHKATVCEENLTKLRAELDKILQDNAAETTRLKSDISRDQDRILQLQSSKDDIESQLAQLRTKKDLMQRYLNDFARQLKESAKTNTDLALEQARLEAQIGILEVDKEQSQVQSDRNIAQISELRQKYDGVSERLKTAAQEQGELQGRYFETQAQLRAAEASVADLDSRFASTDALITAADEKMRKDLGGITEIIGEGMDELTAGLERVLDLTNGTRSDIAEARKGFTDQFAALQGQLASSELASRTEILQAIASLKEQNQRDMAALQANLAQTAGENNRLQALYAQEQAAKAQMEGQLAAKNQEIAIKDRQHAEALQAARQAAADTAQQVKAANDQALESKDAEFAARAEGLYVAYSGRLEILNGQLTAAIARGDAAAEASVADRAALQTELANVRAAIAAIPPPAPVAAPVAAPLPPIITGREPPVDVEAPQGSNIRIRWNPRETRGPWILRVDYDGVNPDFQEVTDPGPIVYTVKRTGALLGTIYSVTVV